MSGVFQNIDPPPPSPPGECVPPAFGAGEDTFAGWRGRWGSIFLEDADTALYSTYVSTLWFLCCDARSSANNLLALSAVKISIDAASGAKRCQGELLGALPTLAAQSQVLLSAVIVSAAKRALVGPATLLWLASQSAAIVSAA
jgi:hypothetical protein